MGLFDKMKEQFMREIQQRQIMNHQPGFINRDSDSNLEINNNNRNPHQPVEDGNGIAPNNSDKDLPQVRKSSISNGMLSPRDNDTPNDFAQFEPIPARDKKMGPVPAEIDEV